MGRQDGRDCFCITPELSAEDAPQKGTEQSELRRAFYLAAGLAARRSAGRTPAAPGPGRRRWRRWSRAGSLLQHPAGRVAPAAERGAQATCLSAEPLCRQRCGDAGGAAGSRDAPPVTAPTPVETALETCWPTAPALSDGDAARRSAAKPGARQTKMASRTETRHIASDLVQGDLAGAGEVDLPDDGLDESDDEREHHQLDGHGDGGADGLLGDEAGVLRDAERDEAAGQRDDEVVLDDGDADLAGDEEEAADEDDVADAPSMKMSPKWVIPASCIDCTRGCVTSRARPAMRTGRGEWLVVAALAAGGEGELNERVGEQLHQRGEVGREPDPEAELEELLERARRRCRRPWRIQRQKRTISMAASPFRRLPAGADACLGLRRAR